MSRRLYTVRGFCKTSQSKSRDPIDSEINFAIFCNFGEKIDYLYEGAAFRRLPGPKEVCGRSVLSKVVKNPLKTI